MKNTITAMLLAVFVSGGLFAQAGEGFEIAQPVDPEITEIPEPAKPSRAMNALTVDLGPLIIGVGIGGALSQAGGVSGSSRGFGIGVQYERHINDMFSVAGRFAFMNPGFSISIENSTASFDMSSFSIEGHGRIYPFRGTFFADLMAGYANFNMKLAASSVSSTFNKNYLKMGAKLGWKIAFGKRRGGFTFEPAFGYNLGLDLGGKNFETSDLGRYEEYLGDEVKNALGDLNTAGDTIAQFFFVGGPRLSLAFGWAF